MDARRRHREVHSRGAPMARDACRAHLLARCMLCSGRVGFDETVWSSRGSRGPWIRYEAAAMAGRTCPFPCRTRKRSSPAAIIARRAKAARCRFFCLWEKYIIFYCYTGHMAFFYLFDYKNLILFIEVEYDPS